MFDKIFGLQLTGYKVYILRPSFMEPEENLKHWLMW